LKVAKLKLANNSDNTIKVAMIQTMWKLCFHKVKLPNFHKIGKYGKKIGKNFHIASIDTASRPWISRYWL